MEDERHKWLYFIHIKVKSVTSTLKKKLIERIELNTNTQEL